MGKTTCAAAAAVAGVESGRRVLLVSTDPAHSLRDVFDVGEHEAPFRGRASRARPTPVPTRRGELHAVELDADRALDRWIARRRRPLGAILSRGTYLDEDDIDRFLRLSLPGVDELMGLVELTRLAGEAPWDEIVVDTAPTGHTLRLLEIPATLARMAAVLDDMQAKHRFLAESLSGAHRRDAADALIEEIAADGRALQALLRDPARCTFAWVLLPETLALQETRDAVGRLAETGIAVAEIVVNRITPPAGGPCALCEGRRRAEGAVIAATRAAFPCSRLRLVPAFSDEPRGLDALLAVGRLAGWGAPGGRRAPRAALRAIKPGRSRPDGRRWRGRAAPSARPAPATRPGGRDTERWLERLAPPGLRLLLFAGKGGVGKTSCAAAVALALARRSPAIDIILLSTDPAPSLGDVLAVPVDDAARPLAGVPRLAVREVDADRAFAARRLRYRNAVDELFAALRGDSRFDLAFDRTIVQDLIDLAPPGLDELLGILTVIEESARYDVVVLDTAPTGHALRLLQMPEAALQWVHALMSILLKYRKVIGLGELGLDLVAVSRDLRRLRALLTDPAATRLVAVTRAAELPRRETRRLLAGVRRLGIPVGAVLVNALTPPGCARCRRAATAEARALAAQRREGRSPRRPRCDIIAAPAVAPPPRGREALARWRARWELDRETV